MKKNIIISILCLTFTYVVAQDTVKKIQIIHSNTLETTERFGPDLKILIGNVQFYHDSATMFCDSAYYNTAKNFFEAFGRIHILKPTQKDTVQLYGDTLIYNGEIKLAKVRKNVKLTKDSMVLTTNHLDFDLEKDVGYYFNGGRTVNNQDTLISKFGYYYSRKDELFFKEKVRIYNPKYTILSDTLMHNMKTSVSNFLGPTEIISKSDYIYCENGWYDHENDKAQFNKNAFLRSKEHSIRGDSLQYDRKKGIGRAFRNVEVVDTLQNAILLGEYGIFNEKTERSMLTGKALFIQFSDKDSLFLHADTLWTQKDTVQNDTTTYRLIKAFHHVKIFRRDFQAKCDSLIYTFLDSVIQMHRKPVIWSDENQLSADYIEMKIVNNEPKQVDMKNNAFIISQSDSINFDQIKGLSMTGYLEKKILHKVHVNDAAQVVYFIKDKLDLLGVNKIESTRMIIYLENNKVNDIWFYEAPKGTVHPPFVLSESELKLDGFNWQIKNRPCKREDVFLWVEDELPPPKIIKSNKK